MGLKFAIFFPFFVIFLQGNFPDNYTIFEQMPDHTLQLSHSLKGSLQHIYPSVLDMRQFGNHHPYMREVSLVQTTPEYSEYLIKEMVWIFGFIPQWPKYTAKVFEKEKDKHIQYTSKVKGGVDLLIDFHFSFNNMENSTLLDEHIRLNGNNLVCKILLGAIKNAHPVLFRNLQNTL